MLLLYIMLKEWLYMNHVSPGSKMCHMDRYIPMACIFWFKYIHSSDPVRQFTIQQYVIELYAYYLQAMFYAFNIFPNPGNLLILHKSHCKKSSTYNSHRCSIGSTLKLCISNQFKTFEQWESELRGVFSLQPTLWKMSSDNTICTSVAVSTKYAL